MATLVGTVWIYMTLTYLYVHRCAKSLIVEEMDTQCGEILAIRSPVLLRLTRDGQNYRPNMMCSLRLLVKSGHPLNIEIRSLNVHVKSETTCHDSLEIFAGYDPTLFSMTGTVCHNNSRTVKGQNLPSKYMIRFTSDSSGEDRGFELLLTPFHIGYCKDDEYDCRSARCVPIDATFVNCNTTYNYCGDDSDYCPKSDNTDLFIMTYIITGLLPLLFAVGLCTWHYRKRGKQNHDTRRRIIAEEILASHDVESNQRPPPDTLELAPPTYTPPCPPPPYSTLPRGYTYTDERSSNRTGNNANVEEESTPPPPYEAPSR